MTRRSLHDDLRARDGDQLHALLLARPDLRRPPPRDLDGLASRAGTPASVGLALSTLTLGELAVLGWLHEHGPADASEVGAGFAVPDEVVTPSLTHLWRIALVWRTEARWYAVRAAGAEATRRFGRPPAAADLQPPPVSPGSVTPEQIDAAGGTEILTLLAKVESLAEAWSVSPPAQVRGGSLSVRALAKTAKDLDLAPEEVVFLAHLLRDAGLLDDELLPDDSSVFAPSDRYDDWRDLPAGRRWRVLVHGWWTSSRRSALVGGAVRALSAEAQDHRFPLARALVAREAARRPPGSTLSATDLIAVCRWRHPHTVEPQVWVEALNDLTRLGLVAAGAATTALRTLLAGGDVESTVAIPAPVTSVIIQADLTVIVPGPPDVQIAALLRDCADLESGGAASVYRLSAESVRRALERGRTADSLLAELTAAGSTALPQPLVYLVHEQARARASVTIGGATAYLTVDDPRHLDAALAALTGANEGVRRLAPTVAVLTGAPVRLVEVLRAAGLSPTVDAGDGHLVAVPRRGVRATATKWARRTVPSLDTAVVAPREDDPGVRALAERLAGSARAPDVTDDPVPRCDPETTLELVREAIDSGSPLWLGVTDGGGTASAHLFHPSRVEGGVVHGIQEGSARPTSVPVHRVTGARPAGEPLA